MTLCPVPAACWAEGWAEARCEKNSLKCTKQFAILLKKNRIFLDDKFVISENSWRLSQSGYSSMFIMINDEVSVENLLKGIIIASGNDACVALAEGIAGSEETFAEMMNEKAAEIGMSSTNFSNASGINDPENYSTVRDIALMSKYLIKNYPEFYQLYSEKTFRSIYHMQPFVIWGQVDCNKKLADYGYTIYDDWFDMSFDSIKDPARRWIALWREVRKQIRSIREMRLEDQVLWKFKNERVLTRNFKTLLEGKYSK